MEESKKIVITVTEPVIKKVTLLEGGKKGILVVHTRSMFRDGVRSNISDKGETHSRPVHKDLRILFKELVKTYLEMMGYTWKKESELELLKGRTVVTSLLYDKAKDSIQLEGVVKVTDKYKFTCPAPMMNMSDVYEAEEVMEIIDKILFESKLFVSGVRGMERNDLSKAYMEKKQGVAAEEVDAAFNKLSPEEKEALLTAAFEDSGLEVIEEDGKMVIGVKDEVKQGNSWVNPEMEVVEDEEPAFDKTEEMPVFADVAEKMELKNNNQSAKSKVKKSAVKVTVVEEPVMNITEDEEFVLPISLDEPAFD